MDEVTTLIKQLGFGQTCDVVGKSSLSEYLPSHIRLGIYILHFQDGSYYIGQSIDVAKRFQQHRRYWEEPIIRFNYKSVLPYELNLEENIAIESFKSLRKSLPKVKQFRIRNIKGNEYGPGEADFDFLMPIAEQAAWLEDPNKVDIHGERSVFPDLRQQYAEKFQRKFMKKPFAADVLEVMREYVRHTIPAVLQTEAVFWGASCVPSTWTYSRININWQEVFAAWDADALHFHFFMSFTPTGLPEGVMKLIQNFGEVYITAENLHTIENPDGDEFELELQQAGFTQQDRQKLARLLQGFFRTYPTLAISHLFHKPGGEDQIHLQVQGKQDALALIKDTNFRLAMRTMNLRLMRLGSSMWGKNHCMDLIDHFIQ